MSVAAENTALIAKLSKEVDLARANIMYVMKHLNASLEKTPAVDGDKADSRSTRLEGLKAIDNGLRGFESKLGAAERVNNWLEQADKSGDFDAKEGDEEVAAAEKLLERTKITKRLGNMKEELGAMKVTLGFSEDDGSANKPILKSMKEVQEELQKLSAEYSVTTEQCEELRMSSSAAHFLFDRCGNCGDKVVSKSALFRDLTAIWGAENNLATLYQGKVAEILATEVKAEHLDVEHDEICYAREGINRIAESMKDVPGSEAESLKVVSVEAEAKSLKLVAEAALDELVADTKVKRADLINKLSKPLSLEVLRKEIKGLARNEALERKFDEAAGQLKALYNTHRMAIADRRAQGQTTEPSELPAGVESFLQLTANTQGCADAGYHAPALPNAAQANGMLGADSANDNIHNVFTLMFFLLAMFLVSKVWRKMNKTHGRALKNGESAGTPLASFSQLS